MVGLRDKSNRTTTTSSGTFRYPPEHGARGHEGADERTGTGTHRGRRRSVSVAELLTMMNLVIATSNEGKRLELEQAFGALHLRLCVPEDVGGPVDRDAYVGNVRKKA